MNSSDALTKAFGGGPWLLHASRSNFVYFDPTRVAKVARPTPHGLAQLENGVEHAFVLHEFGVPVVLPLLDYVEETALGPTSLWPLVEHVNVTPRTITPTQARELGRVISLVARCNVGVSTPWDPFSRVTHRLENSTFPWSTIRRTQKLAELVEPMSRLVSGFDYEMAHGDAAISNCLFLADGSVVLIDLDQSGWRPRHWDIANLYNNLVIEQDNVQAFVAFLEGHGDVDEVARVGAVMEAALVKATLTTTFGLTLEPTPEHISAMRMRLDQMFEWVAGKVPQRLAVID